MNSTRTLAIVAVLTAATLVVGVTFAATTHPAFADKKKDNGNEGNTVTIQANKQKGTQSGWDNDFEQTGTNLICTHPDSTCQRGD
jgi:hypothetical protein